MTFPKHYSIATGLYLAYHGIVNNDCADPVTGAKFNRARRTISILNGGSVTHIAYMDPFEVRVKNVLDYFDSPNKDGIPSLIALYLLDPDSQGHKYGPDDPRIIEAIAHIDRTIGLLI
ncbi:hypothetical protein Scep_007700 [Stephania cephalantha]|uniref:Uncharacterized protein n=1 Tax=Stephania cephalantha TaxID=152367 RepID=A0AAP0PLD1_9MAGN